MYKLLLCWRYLRTRYIALASIISVMLGVATMIVVNSVMAGFTHEMQERIHGILSDLVFESRWLDGFPTPTGTWSEIRRVAGDDIAGMSPTVHVPAMLSFQSRRPVRHQAGQPHRRRRRDVRHGERLRPATCSTPTIASSSTFNSKNGGYDTANHEAAASRQGASPRPQMSMAGWLWRKQNGQLPGRRPSPRAGSTEANPVQRRRNPLAVAHAARRRLRPRQGTARRLRARHRAVLVSQARRRRPLPRAAGRRRGDHLSHRRHAAQAVERKVHGRRLLRKQDERIRLELRVRADPQAAGTPRHDRPVDGRRQRQLDPDQAQARRRLDAVRDKLRAALPAAAVHRSAPGATSKARCWPPCKWKRPCSTCCCS